MAVDLLSSLIERWDADGTLAAAGLVPLRFGGAPGAASYPFCVITQISGKVERRAFGGGRVDHEVYRVAIWSPDEDTAAELGAAAEAFLDGLSANPLIFDDGAQLAFLPAGDTLQSTKRQGTGPNPYVFVKSLVYSAKVWKS